MSGRAQVEGCVSRCLAVRGLGVSNRKLIFGIQSWLPLAIVFTDFFPLLSTSIAFHTLRGYSGS